MINLKETEYNYATANGRTTKDSLSWQKTSSGKTHQGADIAIVYVSTRSTTLGHATLSWLDAPFVAPQSPLTGIGVGVIHAGWSTVKFPGEGDPSWRLHVVSLLTTESKVKVCPKF